MDDCHCNCWNNYLQKGKKMKQKIRIALGLTLFPITYPMYLYKCYQGMKLELKELRELKWKVYAERLGINQ